MPLLGLVVDLAAFPNELDRLFLHPLLDIVAHILRDLHRAEVRPAHRAEMRDLGTFLRQGLVVELLCRVRVQAEVELIGPAEDRKSTRLNSSHLGISYAVFCLKKKTNTRKNKK